MRKTSNLTGFVLTHDAFWAIDPKAGERLWRQLEAITIEVHQREIEARGYVSEGGGGSKDYPVEDGVAVISMVGPMTKAPTSFDEGCSTTAIRRQIRTATMDPDVKAIMLRIDSPGGSVSGTEALAKDFASAGKRKPTMAYCEDCCCSAAYWVGSQAREVRANPTAMVGSIGTYTYLVDLSQLYEDAGVKVHVVSTGQFKGTGVEGTPVSDDDVADVQRLVDQLNEHFLQGVAQGRSMDMSDLRKIADGRVWVGQDRKGTDDAKSLGLIDGVSSFDKALTDLRESARTPASGARADSDITEAILAEETVTPIVTAEACLETARIAAESACERITAIAAIRESQDRPFSATRLAQAREAHQAFGDAIAAAEALSQNDTQPESGVRDGLRQMLLRQTLAAVR